MKTRSSFLGSPLAMMAVVGLAAAMPNHVKRAVLGTATINLAVPQGTPAHLASGFLYGIPDTAGQVPSQFYTDIGFNYGRAGGSQLPAPARGWVHGQTEFLNRFQSALSNYKTARSHGARFQILVADLWGADGTSGIAMPGDNGDWTSYDAFLDALLGQIQSNGMQAGLDYEIWNEPDGGLFWLRNETQFLEMWGRTYAHVRKVFPTMPIIGPCTASQPSVQNGWYAQYYPFVLANGSIPDAYCWHEESGGDDVATDIENNIAALKAHNLPWRPIMINEYAVASEQVAGASAWYISRLERYNATGLRGNWASAYSLHDYFANLLGKPNANDDCTNLATCGVSTGYWGNGQYNVYKYYNMNMTGQRLQTVGSPDKLFDIYATKDSKSIKMLCGSRVKAGTWDILVTNLSALGLPSSGTITIQAYQFNDAGIFGEEVVVNQGTYPHTYTNDQLVFYVSPSTTTAYAFEFAI